MALARLGPASTRCLGWGPVLSGARFASLTCRLCTRQTGRPVSSARGGPADLSLLHALDVHKRQPGTARVCTSVNSAFSYATPQPLADVARPQTSATALSARRRLD